MDVTYGFRAFPGQCMSCGSSDPVTKVADFGETPGGMARRFRMYLCADCCVGAATLLADHVGKVVVAKQEFDDLTDAAGDMQVWRDRAEAAEDKLATLAGLAADL